MDGGGTQETVSVSKIAQRCLAEAGNDICAAQKLMERLVSKTPPLFHDLMQPLVAGACYDALRATVRAERGKIWTAPNYTKAGNGERLEATALTLLDFVLPTTMRPIRDANKADLLEASDWYGKQAENMRHKSAWLAMIAAKVGRKTVGQKFSATELQELQEAAK